MCILFLDAPESLCCHEPSRASSNGWKLPPSTCGIDVLCGVNPIPLHWWHADWLLNAGGVHVCYSQRTSLHHSMQVVSSSGVPNHVFLYSRTLPNLVALPGGRLELTIAHRTLFLLLRWLHEVRVSVQWAGLA